jgi:hypothetical protein
MGGTI